MDKLLLRPAEAADAIGVSRSRMYELLATGTIPSIKIGGSRRVPVETLRTWVDRQLSRPMPENSSDTPALSGEDGRHDTWNGAVVHPSVRQRVAKPRSDAPEGEPGDGKVATIP